MTPNKSTIWANHSAMNPVPTAIATKAKIPFNFNLSSSNFKIITSPQYSLC
jgi:hypothetical protein